MLLGAEVDQRFAEDIAITMLIYSYLHSNYLCINPTNAIGARLKV